MFKVEALREWLKLSTSAEKEELERVTGVSRNYIYQLTNGNRAMSAAMAGVIADSANAIGRQSKGRLPILKRKDLCEACSNCPHAK